MVCCNYNYNYNKPPPPRIQNPGAAAAAAYKYGINGGMNRMNGMNGGMNRFATPVITPDEFQNRRYNKVNFNNNDYYDPVF